MKLIVFAACMFAVSACYSEPKSVRDEVDMDIRACYHFNKRDSQQFATCAYAAKSCADFAGNDVSKYTQCMRTNNYPR